MINLFKPKTIKLNDPFKTTLNLKNMIVVYTDIKKDDDFNYSLMIRFIVLGGTDLKTVYVAYARDYDACINDQKKLFDI